MRRRGLGRFNLDVTTPTEIDGLSLAALKALVVQVLSKVAEQAMLIGELREENARLKGLSGRPLIKPSGMEQSSEPKLSGKRGRRRRGKAAPRVAVRDRVIKAQVPPGSRFKGYEAYVVQDVMLRAEVVRYRRERWITPDGTTVLAPLPPGVAGHFGPELRRFVLAQHHQGQVTVPRLVAQLRAIGVSISKRQVMRLLIAGQDNFLAENREVLRAGLQTAAWITVDDTGARHAGKNGFCTQIGNDDFAWFGTRSSKSRLNFLDHRIKSGGRPAARRTHRLRRQSGGAGLYARACPGRVCHPSAGHASTDAVRRSGCLANACRPPRHQRTAGHTRPRCIATEGALWGSIQAHRLLREMVIVSDDAGEFAVWPACAVLGTCGTSGA